MNKVTCVRGVAQRDEIGATPGDMDEGPAAFGSRPRRTRAARDVYPRFYGRHGGEHWRQTEPGVP